MTSSYITFCASEPDWWKNSELIKLIYEKFSFLVYVEEYNGIRTKDWSTYLSSVFVKITANKVQRIC